MKHLHFLHCPKVFHNHLFSRLDLLDFPSAMKKLAVVTYLFYKFAKEFHLKTMDRANQHTETSSVVSSIDGSVQVPLLVSSLLIVEDVIHIILLLIN